MICDFYNLREQPFGVTPDPRFLYMSPSHREALASLSYGIKGRRGFMSLIAQPGMGKTTILSQLLNQLKTSARTSYLFQTLCRPEELLRALLHDLGVTEHSGNMVDMQEQLNRVLWEEASHGRTVVVVIDEAQNLDDSTLELVRMLSNFETTSEKLMQIILAGQLQLRDKLASERLVQLRQRISIRARLSPFNATDTHLYIEQRLRVAGYDFRKPLFTRDAEALIRKHSEGIPRNINNLCFNALSLGWVLKQRTIEKDVIREVLSDLDLEPEGNEVSSLGWMRWKANKPEKTLQSFAWVGRVAVRAMLLVALLMSPVGRGAKPVAAIPVQAISGSAVQAAAPLVLENPDNSSRVAGRTSKSEPQIVAVTAVTQPKEASRTDGTLRTTSMVARSRAALVQPNDPVTLWQQIKKGRSDAEVELARVYLEGASMERNCTQARVLLQDASRKGNTHAADLLANLASQCQ